MTYKGDEILRRVGLSSRKPGGGAAKPVLLTGAATDPRTGLIVSLASETKFSADQSVSEMNIRYWRHVPYGESRQQNLISVKMAPGEKPGTGEIDQVWVQSQCVFDRARGDSLDDPAMRKKVNRVLEGVNRLNGHLRAGGAVEDTARILAECYFDEVLGEHMIVRGLKKEGGFDFSLSSYFTKMAAGKKPFEIADADLTLLKTVLGFRLNTLERDKDFSASREVMTTDPQSGMTYLSGVTWNKARNGRFVMETYVRPENPEESKEAASIPNLLRLEFTPGQGRRKGYVLEEAQFLGRKVDVTDIDTVSRLIGLAQASNRQFAEWKYPTYMDNTAEYDLLDKVDQLAPPPSLEKEGGEFLYASLHGSGSEKKVENYGDQIGIAALFLQRGLKENGEVSTVGVAIDFPFAAGGPESNFDGAVPDYLPFWDDIKAFFMTHDHFDHCDGLAYYAKAGLMKNKKVFATPQVKYFLDKKMDYLRVPKNHRPQITLLKEEGAFPVKDEDGVTRVWVQHSPNATRHSALCTPYIVSGVYGDKHYNGSSVIYGDGSAMTEQGKEFFRKGLSLLAKEDGVPKALLDSKPTVVMHDPTAIRYEGHAPERDRVENVQTEVFSWFSDKGVLLSPISTNDAEYTIGTNVAHKTGRDITAVGRNAELRTACKNLFGMSPDLDLRTVRLDPFEEYKKQDPLIPRDVLDIYFRHYTLSPEDELPKSEEEYNSRLQKARSRALSAEKEKLEPSERGHNKDTRQYMLDSLFKHDAVVFENDINGYLMWKAIMDRQKTASVRATRTSKMAKDFRVDPSRLMIFITGTQGNAEEKFSTIQKFSNFFSLLDVDDSVRNSGYKINAEDFVAVITQSAIPGNDDAQERMIRDLVRNRDITVVGAFMDGFKVYNPKDKAQPILSRLQQLGWKHQTDTEGNIRVYGQSIHVHGHGFKQDLLDIARTVSAETHEIHHVPDRDTYDVFRNVMRDARLNHSGVTPDDFQVFRIRNDAAKTDKFSKVAELNPSYVLVRLARKYGQFYNGWLELVRATMLRREGGHRADGLMARTEKTDGYFERKTAQQAWELAANPSRRSLAERERKLGPSLVERGHARKPRSRSVWSAEIPEVG